MKILHLFFYLTTSLIYSAKCEDNVQINYPFTYMVPLLSDSYQSKEQLQKQYDIIKEKFDQYLYQKEFEIDNSKYIFYMHNNLPLGAGSRELDGWKFNHEAKSWDLFLSALNSEIARGRIHYDKSKNCIELIGAVNNRYKDITVISLRVDESGKILLSEALKEKSLDLIFINKSFKKESSKKLKEKYRNHYNKIQTTFPEKKSLRYEINEITTHYVGENKYYIFILYPIVLNGCFRYKIDGWSSFSKEKNYNFTFTYYIDSIADPQLMYHADQKTLKLIDLSNKQEKMTYLLEAPQNNPEENSPAQSSKE